MIILKIIFKMKWFKKMLAIKINNNLFKIFSNNKINLQANNSSCSNNNNYNNNNNNNNNNSNNNSFSNFKISYLLLKN